MVVFAFDGFDQTDLDLFASSFNLPQFTWMWWRASRRPAGVRPRWTCRRRTPWRPTRRRCSSTPTRRSRVGAYEKIAAMMEDADRRYPGAVWSFSIGWGCDKLITAADLVPVRSALAKAQANGTTAFDASGDLAGLECKGGQEWSAPPSANDIGLDAVASMPEMVNVGHHPVHRQHRRLAGRAGLVRRAAVAGLGRRHLGAVRPAGLAERPAGLRGAGGSAAHPDISAVADPFTGVKIVFDQQFLVGGGTSLAAPIWAGRDRVDEPVPRRERRPADRRPQPAALQHLPGCPVAGVPRHRSGGNAVAHAGPGYDLVDRLGTPTSTIWSATS